MRPVNERGAESVLAKMGSEHGGRTTRCKRRLETMKFQNDV